jgi:hypothetical protein
VHADAPVIISHVEIWMNEIKSLSVSLSAMGEARRNFARKRGLSARAPKDMLKSADDR